jgi:hypothetical protein
MYSAAPVMSDILTAAQANGTVRLLYRNQHEYERITGRLGRTLLPPPRGQQCQKGILHVSLPANKWGVWSSSGISAEKVRECGW